jgi:hypothetical protein
MKPIILSIITISLFFNSCAQEAKNDVAGQPAESPKKKADDKLYPVESYYTDNAKHWTVVTTSTVHKISSNFITVVAANLQQGQSWTFASYRFKKKMYFLGQIITLDEPNRISLYFKVEDPDHVEFIFQASYTKGNEPIVKEISKNNKKEWERISDLIEMK